MIKAIKGVWGVYEADTCSAVILGGTGRGVTSVAPQGAVGAGAGRSSLTG